MLRLLALVLLVLPASALAIEVCGSGPRLNCVVDGDTFWWEGEKIRAMGYDTPEPTSNVCGGDVERELARKATARLVELFNTTKISIERHGKDKYGRTLAVVRSNGWQIGDILVGEGLARAWPDGCEFWCQTCN
ncbi:thermonuclease family protein [Ruegeria marisflavi]|nr:thermonuclease family protein [Ruegeria sp. WL0004]